MSSPSGEEEEAKIKNLVQIIKVDTQRWGRKGGKYKQYKKASQTLFTSFLFSFSAPFQDPTTDVFPYKKSFLSFFRLRYNE